MSTEPQRIQFRYSELGDPLVFTEIPTWIQTALTDRTIWPYEGGEDYWYLKVPTADGLVQVGPGDWISHDNGTFTCEVSAQ